MGKIIVANWKMNGSHDFINTFTANFDFTLPHTENQVILCPPFPFLASFRDIFKGSLVLNHPDYAVTFVDNHDTQIGQSLESWIEAWFKRLAYALILLRPGGIPSVFYGDYYGVKKPKLPPVEDLSTIMKVRQSHTHGTFLDYLDDPECIGWTYSSGMAVIMSNGSRRLKKMHIGKDYANKRFVDILNPDHEILMDSKGNGMFEVDGKDLAIYLEKSPYQPG